MNRLLYRHMCPLFGKKLLETTSELAFVTLVVSDVLDNQMIRCWSSAFVLHPSNDPLPIL